MVNILFLIFAATNCCWHHLIVNALRTNTQKYTSAFLTPPYYNKQRKKPVLAFQFCRGDNERKKPALKLALEPHPPDTPPPSEIFQQEEEETIGGNIVSDDPPSDIFRQEEEEEEEETISDNSVSGATSDLPTDIFQEEEEETISDNIESDTESDPPPPPDIFQEKEEDLISPPSDIFQQEESVINGANDDLKEEIQKLKDEMKAMSEDLEMKIIIEKSKTLQAETKLESFQQQQNLTTEKDDTIAKLQAELESQRFAYETEILSLQNEIHEGDRKRKLKIRQMSKRYDNIRSELNDLLERTRREGRTNERRLKRRYEERILELEAKEKMMERKLSEMVMDNDKRDALLDILEKQKGDWEKGMIEKDRVIERLAGELNGLREDMVRKKDADKKEKDSGVGKKKRGLLGSVRRVFKKKLED